MLTAIGTGDYDFLSGLLLQSDNKIVASGDGYSTSHTNLELARYTTTGALDTTFGTGGKVITVLPSNSGSANALVQLGDGKIMAAGGGKVGTTPDFLLIRYNTNGTVDTAFGGAGTGMVFTDVVGLSDSAFSLILQPDGKFVTSGYGTNGNSQDMEIMRHNADGTLDTGFGVSGRVALEVGGKTDTANAVALQSDGKIVAAGSASNGSNNDFGVVRYYAGGGLDIGFGSLGKAKTPIGTANDGARAVTVQADGKIVAAGYSRDTTVDFDDFALVRYNTNGSLDTTFGIGGKVTTDVSFDDQDQATAVLQQPDGKLVAAGYSFQSGIVFAVARYNTNGTLDSAFGTGGIATAAMGGSNYALAMTRQTDGKLVVAGYATFTLTKADFALARFNTDGSLDSTFGSGGTVTTDFASNFDYGYAVLQQTDGKLVVAGYTLSGTNYNIALARYNSNGTLDTTFDGDGKLTTDIAGSTDNGFGIAQQSDGKLVVAGYALTSNSDVTVVRYNTNGTLDTTFDGDGKVTTNVAGSASTDQARAVVLQPADGKIVVVGSANGDFAVLRYLSN